MTTDGVKNADDPNNLTGYGFVTADSMDAAIEIAKGCPILQDGGSVEVASVHEM